jgi:hypothetical protein
MITNLKLDFEELLVSANEIWFAVALIKDSTYGYVQEKLTKDCKQNCLVG